MLSCFLVYLAEPLHIYNTGGECLSYEVEENKNAGFHSLIMEGREKLKINGVEDVSGFDESLVILSTALGELNIRGGGLHVEKIDLDSGFLELRGNIQELSYNETQKSASMWKRLFG